MDFNTLCEIIEEAGYSPRSYSGRGMYGKQCVGFTFEGNTLDAVADLFEVAAYYDHGVFELARVVKSAQTDNMGMDTVIYFPRVKWAEKD